MAGFWSSLLSGLRGAESHTLFTPRVTHLGTADMAALLNPSELTVAQLWKSQPHFRTVVTFLARNIAQLGLHSFERVDQNDRRRDRTSVLAQTLRDVDGHMTSYELKFALVGDLALYDRAYWWAAPSSDTASGWMLRRLPPSWVEPIMANPWEVDRYRVFVGGGAPMELPAENVLAFPGFAPGKMSGASPTVDALRETLQEQVEAARYRAQVWKRGGRVSSVLERPKDAPAWSDEARESFREDWYAKFTGRGSRAGGTPILEDGMTLKRIDFNAQEQQFVEAAKLSLVTVASAFHVNPTMIGQNDGANYSNVREFRKMLYGDTLGPTIAQIEDRINTFLVPRMGLDPARHYVEFNIDEKLQGNFEEQAAALQAATGAPWMTRNEARAVRNLPAVDGGDELVTPLNVLVGGQASPVDGVTGGGGGAVLTGDDLKQRVDAAAALIRSGFDPAGALAAVGLDPIKHLGLLPVTVQKPVEPAEDVDEGLVDEITEASKGRKSGPDISRVSDDEPVRIKGATREADERAAAEVLRRFFKRQRAVVLTALGAKAGDGWWDAERWDAELADDLFRLAVKVTGEIGAETAESLGYEGSGYDVDRTLKFLRAVAEARAGAINSTTLAQIKAALAHGADDDDDDAAQRSTPAGVFELAEGSRADVAGVTLATTLVTFAITEFGRQQSRAGTTKTWVNTSGNPRPSHAVMDGETVPIDQPFSNGMDWPGDPAGGVDEVAGCSCVVDITIP